MTHRIPTVVAATGMLIAVLVGCATTSSSGGPEEPGTLTTSPPAPSVAIAGEVPPVNDVPVYKADPARTGVQPGPAPTARPVTAWQAELGCAPGGRTGVIGSGLLIVGCDADRLLALDARSGATKWTADLEGASIGSPAISDGSVYVSQDGGAFSSLDLATGAQRWTVPLDANRHPVVVGDTVYVGTLGGRFLGLSTADGSETWSWSSPTDAGEAAGTVVDGVAYIGTGDGVLHAVSVADTSELWRFQTSSGRVSTPAIVDETVVVSGLQDGGQGSGEIYALELETGVERWRHRAESGHQIAPPTLMAGTVYSPSAMDGLFAFSAADGTLLWNVPTEPMGGVPPALVDDTIVLSMDRTVAAFDRATGATLWEFTLDSGPDSSPLVSGGMVFVADKAGILRALAEPGLAARLPGIADDPGPTADPAASPLPPAELVATFEAAPIGLDQPSGMDVGPDGDLYVVNALKSEIVVIDPADQRVLRRWGSQGSKPGQFSFQRTAEQGSALGGVAVADDGDVYVADPANRRVQVFSADGTFLRQWGRFGDGDGQFLDPTDVALGPDGRVYVVDSQRDDIQRFTADGQFIDIIGSHGVGPGQMKYTGSITIESDGTIVNADWGNHRFQAWDETGAYLWTGGTPGTALGQLDEPADVAIDDAGRFHVIDHGRLQTFDADRRPIRLTPTGTDAFGLAYGDGMLYVSAQFADKILQYRATD